MSAQTAKFTPEEYLGIVAAIGLHVALAAAFLLHDDDMPIIKPPERIVVSLASEVSLESTAPDPSAEPAASVAPVLSDVSAPVVEPDVREPVREPVQETVTPRPQPTRTIRARPTSAPTPRATRTSPPRPTPTVTPRAQPTRSGGSRIGDDFLNGSSSANGNSGSAAATFGRAEQASLLQAISRQIKPHWSTPQGADAELLVTILRWELNRDGTLKGRPVVVSQSGINASNRPQADLHAERAIRAVQLAAPFNLPPRFYDKWRRIREWRFDRRL